MADGAGLLRDDELGICRPHQLAAPSARNLCRRCFDLVSRGEGSIPKSFSLQWEQLESVRAMTFLSLFSSPTIFATEFIKNNIEVMRSHARRRGEHFVQESLLELHLEDNLLVDDIAPLERFL